MRTNRLILLLCIACVSVWAGAHNYVGTSRLATGRFVKIRVTESGVYRLTYSELKQMGLQPENLRIYGYGGGMLEQDFRKDKIDDLPAVPFYMSKGSDGKFSEGDYVLFYGQGIISWRYTGTRFLHTKNTYSDYGYYFLSDNAGEQHLLKPLSADFSTTEAYDVTTYTNYQVHETDELNMIDKTGREGGGREWYGERIEVGHPLSIDFVFPDIVSGDPLYANIDIAADPQRAAVLDVKAGNSSQSVNIAQSAADNYVKAIPVSTDGNFVASQGETQRVTLSYSSSINSAGGYLNYVELSATCKLRLHDGYLCVSNTEHLNDERSSLFRVSNATATTQVWNVTRLDAIEAVPTQLSGTELSFVVSNTELQRLIVIDPEQYKPLQPYYTSGGIYYEKVENQNLHALRNVDMLILTHPLFLEQAQALADAHSAEGFVTEVVTSDAVYNEFSSGTPDATAYRWVMKMLYDRALASNGTEKAPQSLLLMGDGTYDNRKLLATSGNNTLLTYQAVNSTTETFAYATDDYFGLLDDNTGTSEISDQMAISVGRLPVNTADAAQAIVNKIIRYMTQPHPGNWKTHLCFLADDGDSNGHTRGIDLAAEATRQRNNDFIIDKIYIDAYQQESNASGESYPIAKNKLDNLLSSGVLFFNYCGHAGYNNLASEQMLTTKEVREMTNQNQGFWMLATCSFGRFDAHTESAAESAILNPQGGAIGIMASCRTVYETQNERLNEILCRNLFTRDESGHFPHTIGEAVRLAKNDFAKRYRDKNKLPYILLCDPALKLLYPDDYSIQVSQFPDTLRALSKNVLQGYIADFDGDTVRDFNGVVSLTLFDKMQQITTNDNDQKNDNKKVRYTYNDYPNTIFNGSAMVEDGKFSLSFMVPKDIRYNYDNGHLTIYATDTLTHEEATGYNNRFTIGGSEEMLISDTIGPEVHIWLNNPAFKDGDNVSAQPHFYASISDENGINTVGNGIGHDLLLVIDNDIKQSYMLNSYFTARQGSYQQGDISYRLSELSDGQHQLSFRAWDLLNNSTTATLNFNVVSGMDPVLYSVIAYPNPVNSGSQVTIQVEHDSPDQVLQCTFLMYDMAGQLVFQLEQTGANRIRFVPAAKSMHSGIYFYRVRIKTETSDFTSKTGKMMVY